ncbi:uncharacterized protein BDCG_02149 [Blastomyces dermatitidis ER-3]|uniref:Uncharacterized protein n=2 Tax=Blastomyces TaxID=229219 RepID=A0A179UI26_BLAGS|nr:uncharacterized protein BDBG_03744 [Blastomyces gilchristii SLH14081]XP_045279928.1 uncharacterized protein BDCG_02149 [Blastomyces dermatitidis ER-3]OAT00201.1 hypothetical protein BDCG_02149 [Blastomyces dermatitidis ER-3]OAT07705.1 hypothetical protein BDBG_03744 [Blastomyces gilchristii SLH14081]
MPLRLSRCYMVTVFSRFQKSFAPEKPGKQFHSGYRLRTLRSNGRQDGSLRCSILDATSATISIMGSSSLAYWVWLENRKPESAGNWNGSSPLSYITFPKWWLHLDILFRNTRRVK